MSRIGSQPVTIPSGVTVDTQDRVVTVKGPKGELTIEYRPELEVAVEDGRVEVSNTRPPRDRAARALHGLTRSLIHNMVVGVTQGYERKLEITGVGYQAKLAGQKLVLSLGFANEIHLDVPDGVHVETPSATNIIVRGCDKQAVGAFAAQIRKQRPPEPYKGKGIKYDGEVVHRKAGKAFGSQ